MKKLTVMLGLTSIVVLHGCAVGAPPAGEAPSADPAAPDPTATEAPPDFRVAAVNWNGIGCRPGSLTYSVSPDKQAFTGRFADMNVKHQAGGSTYQSTNCMIGIALHVPPGWSVAIGSTSTHGHVSLPPGGLARVMVSYSFAGQPLDLSPHGSLLGPRDEDYVFTDQPGPSSIASACGLDASVNVHVRLDLNTTASRSESASISLDTASFKLTWKKCG